MNEYSFSIESLAIAHDEVWIICIKLYLFTKLIASASDNLYLLISSKFNSLDIFHTRENEIWYKSSSASVVFRIL